jgi:hypothetical protein
MCMDVAGPRLQRAVRGSLPDLLVRVRCGEDCEMLVVLSGPATRSGGLDEVERAIPALDRRACRTAAGTQT